MSTSLTTTNFDDLLEEVEQPRHSHLRVDLSEVSFISSGAILFLAVLLEAHATSSDRRPILAVPDSKVHSYLGRAGVFKHLGDLIDVEPPVGVNQLLRYEAFRGNSQTLLELTPLVEEREIEELLIKLKNALRVVLGYQKNDAYDVATAASEILQNVFHHNANGIRAWVAMQVYKGDHGSFVELAIGDSGIGINGSLEKNPKNGTYETDVKAIIHAIQTGASQFLDKDRGNGFDAIMEKVFKHEGTLTIRSGCGKIHIRVDKGTISTFDVRQMKGTQVVVSLPQKEARNGDRA